MSSWYDDFGDGTYQTKTSTVGAGQNTYYDKKFLDVVKQSLKLIPFGQRRPLPMGEGKVIQFFRWLNMTVSVSGATLTEGINPDATKLYGQDLQATLGEYGAFVQMASLFAQTHIDGKISTGIGSISELLGEHAANVMDRLCHLEVCSNGGMPARADADTAETFSGTFTSVTSTSVMADTVLQANTGFGDADADLTQSLLTITSGRGYGQQRAITAYDAAGGASNGLITVSPAFDQLPVAGDGYTITNAAALASGDDLSYTNVKLARKNLKVFRAPTWKGGYYVGLIDPDVANELMDDTVWKNVHTYKDQTTGIFEGEIGKFAGIRFIEETDAFKFPVAAAGETSFDYGVGAGGANFSASGAVTSALIFGQHAFGVTTFKDKMGRMKNPPIIIKTANKYNTGDPLNRYNTAGWVMPGVYKALNPLFMQQIWCYTG